MSDAPTLDDLGTLTEQFPNVPTRILAATLASYLERTGDLSEAVEAARRRIADAIAA